MSNGEEKKPVDLTKVRKGSSLKLKDGRKVHVSGMYLSGDGPIFMVKLGPAQAVANNVPATEVDELL